MGSGRRGERPSQRARSSASSSQRILEWDRRQRLELGLEFGDNDGFEQELFEHALSWWRRSRHSVTAGRASPRNGDWARESGRGMLMADLDFDGDLTS